MPSKDRLKELLVGKKIVEARMEDVPPEDYGAGPTGFLTLSDGMKLKVWGNDGGCACNAGCYPLSALNRVDNVITNVEVIENPHGDNDDDYLGFYRIFVYAEHELIQLASFDGTDGNGYYGTGYYIEVTE